MARTTFSHLGHARLWVAIAIVAAVGGCGKSQMKLERTSANLRDLSQAAIAYHLKNHAWPDSIEQLKSVVGQEGPLGIVGGGRDYAAMIANPETGENPGYEYVKPADDAPAATTVLIYQLRGGQRDLSLPVAYVNGMIHTITPPAP